MQLKVDLNYILFFSKIFGVVDTLISEMIMLKLFSLFSMVLIICAQEIQTPLSVVNPVDVIKYQLTSIIYTEKHNQYLAQYGTVNFVSVNPLTLMKDFARLGNATSDLCAMSIFQFIKDISKSEPYSIKMLDSWGKLESGILEGNLKWLGLYHECLSVMPAHFDTKYCNVFIGKPSTPKPFGLSIPTGITLGGCYPDTCSELNITSLFGPIVADTTNGSDIIQAYCPPTESSWNFIEVFGLSIFCLFICIVIASTIYDYLCSRNLWEYDLLADSSSTNATIQSQEDFGILRKVLTSFSIIKNTKRLLITKQKPTDIHCLHGMRFISMCWVILGHSFLFPISYSNNPLFFARYYIQHFEFQAVGNATFSVDTFFFLSSLLVVYLGLRQLEKNGGRLNVFLMYIYRYIRLTPPYALMILLFVSLWPKLGSGPIWSPIVARTQMACSKYWYTNLLYFNNLYPVLKDDECCGWSWYLANDTQFYILSPIFLYLLCRSPIVGLIVSSLVALFSITITGIFSSITNQQPMAIKLGYLSKMGINKLNGLHSSSSHDLIDASGYNQYVYDLYVKPWCRIGSYMIGVITGYILHAYNKKIRMPKYVAVCGWIVAAAVNCSVLYGLYSNISKGGTDFVEGNLLNVNTAALYNAVSRPVWCMGLAWVVIACTNGYGGPINTFLSWKVFIPLSRLTYCSYLFHPLVIWWFVATSEVPFHISMNLLIMIFSGSLILTTCVAYLISMMIEFPVVELLKLLQSRHGNTEVSKASVNGVEGKSPPINNVNT